ncbi:hypothetical protein [Methylobacterium sp. Leaf91]|uniref:hypothetical protein n=1 Tax=Methylobacterium sp. Leaf91 TaxID=1736247 RepID=UPI0006F93540|nr:hypothetical protein [Methylobacterium sp. Leaf91]KQP00292.1 hypothetical protein ASF32_13720 [Methylobacterium sp. Leaf91]
MSWHSLGAQAQITLKQYDADRSRAACFVDHNARCPCCNAQVFYYQNQYGSRVFFDELAPLWTKHPCTDNGRSTSTSKLAFRSRGSRIEIAEALQAVGEPPRNDWRYGLIGAVENREGHIDLRVQFPDDAQPRTLTFVGDWLPMEPGDVVGTRGSLVSFFDLACMEPRASAVGSRIVRILTQPPGNVSLDRWEADLLKRGTWDHFLTCWKAAPQSVVMRTEEVINFHLDETDVAAFADRMREHTRTAWDCGRRSLASMADYFNVQDLRTACGLAWNDRRVYLLLKVVFYEPSRAPDTGRRCRDQSGTAGRPRPSSGSPVDGFPPSQLTTRQGAHLDLTRLSKLGRIVERKGER